MAALNIAPLIAEIKQLLWQFRVVKINRLYLDKLLTGLIAPAPTQSH